MRFPLTGSCSGTVSWRCRPWRYRATEPWLFNRCLCRSPWPLPWPRWVAAAPAEAEEGWCSEWHGSYRTWLQSLSKAVDHGVLLVIDYALEAARYYAARRSDGTLMAYQGGAAGLDPLASPGAQDLTSHVCIDTLDAAAASQGWQRLDQRRQGEMVLALGLAERLHDLQQLPSAVAAGVATARSPAAPGRSRRFGGVPLAAVWPWHSMRWTQLAS